MYQRALLNFSKATVTLMRAQSGCEDQWRFSVVLNVVSLNEPSEALIWRTMSLRILNLIARGTRRLSI